MTTTSRKRLPSVYNAGSQIHQHNLMCSNSGSGSNSSSSSSTIGSTPSQNQLDSLGSLIDTIRQGSYNEFLSTLEDNSRGGFKNGLLNTFIDGQTALHYSLIYGRSLAWCEQLILKGANPNLATRAGWHPIHLAAFNGSLDTMRYLIDCMANETF